MCSILRLHDLRLHDLRLHDLRLHDLRLHDLAGAEVAKPRNFRAWRSQYDSLRS
jgi:hypothetical protein